MGGAKALKSMLYSLSTENPFGMELAGSGREEGLFMPQLSKPARASLTNAVLFVKWLLYSCLIGVIVGLVAVAFHLGIELATELRGEHPWIISLLPLAGAPTWCW